MYDVHSYRNRRKSLQDHPSGEEVSNNMNDDSNSNQHQQQPIISGEMIYLRDKSGLPRRKVGKEYPVPTGAQDILALDVTMTDTEAVRLLKSNQQLIGNPFLLHE